MSSKGGEKLFNKREDEVDMIFSALLILLQKKSDIFLTKRKLLSNDAHTRELANAETRSGLKCIFEAKYLQFNVYGHILPRDAQGLNRPFDAARKNTTSYD